MNLILAFYSQTAHMDVLLPPSINVDYSAVLSAAQFGLKRDLKVELENLDGVWRIKKSKYYKVEKDGNNWIEKTLAAGDLLYVTTARQKFSLIVRAAGESFGAYTRYSVYRMNELSIGKNENCDICYSAIPVVSRHHASIFFQDQYAIVQDYSANGVYVNGQRIKDRVNLRFGDTVSIYGLAIVYLGDAIAVNSSETHFVEHQRLRGYLMPIQARDPNKDAVQEDAEQLFHRSPRKILTLNTDEEEIEAPPQKQTVNRKPAWMIIGPSFTMAIPMMLGCGFMILARTLSGSTMGGYFMYIGLITAITSAIVGVTWAIINLKYSKQEEQENELIRLQKYSDYLIECANRIQEKYNHNRNAMLAMYPDAATCCTYWHNTSELWTKNRGHDDFLSCRLGVGDIDFQVPITVPKRRFTLTEDELANRPYEIRNSYATLKQVPISVNLLEHRVIGIVGERRYDAARLIMTQLAANNCYTDVRMAVLGNENAKKQWGFAGWFPHVWNDQRSRRYMGFGKLEISDVSYDLTQLFRARTEESANFSRSNVLPVQYVVFVQDMTLLESESVTRYLLEQDADIGVTTILMARRYEDLPNSCDYIIENSSSFTGMYSMAQGGAAPQSIAMDTVSLEEAETLARKISGIRVVENGSGNDLPDSLTFFDMLGVNSLAELNVADNWRKNRTYQTMQAMVGWKSGNTPCYLNIHEKYHGPHGLLAGTTGSGKSETLQTYILSLAINYSPQDVGFFIIDFKGGGMANLFDGLPHLLGTISNLSGNQVHRAMVSIKSENLRRQRVFNEYGVNHLDAYTKLVKSGEATLPIPHMFIIIDEFAELKREEPDFMRELISVAQVGRSLGVHLILATQKPSGTVDDNIWSNTKFRLCLRVADKQDSKDMLHKADAAYLTQAGRCYLQVGNDEIYELFQSGWSGAVYDEDMASSGSNIAVLLENSGKAVSVGSSSRVRKLAARRQSWIASLIMCCRSAKGDTRERLDQMFRFLEEQKSGYADSTYNRRQLESFMRKADAFADLPVEEAAKAMIADADLTKQKLPEQKEITQLDAVVEYLNQIAVSTGNVMDLKLWMPVLPSELPLASIAGVKAQWLSYDKPSVSAADTTLSAVIGMVDDPQNQNQFPLTIDFLENGHLAVCGAVSSGKSTFMQTLAYSFAKKYTPDMLQMYAIDYSSQMLAPLEALPHMGGVVFEGEDDRLAKLFLILNRSLQERKELLRGGSFLQYIKVHGNKVPALLLMIDGYSAFREKTGNAYEDRLIELVRDGAGFGIFVVISAGGFGIGELQNKIADKMRQVVALEMEGKYAYGECLRTMHFDVLPESGVRGRGLAICDDTILEFQTALAASGDDYARGEAIRAECEAIAANWNGNCAPEIPEIPEKPTWELFVSRSEYRRLCADPRYLPVAYNQQDASIYSIDLATNFCYLITGREKTGKSVFLRNIACAAVDSGAKVYLVDKIGQMDEKRTADFSGAEYINTTAQIFEMLKTIILTTNERNLRKKKLVDRGYEGVELFERMKDYQPYVVLFADLNNFIDACQKPADGRGPIASNVETIFKKAAMLQVFFFGAVNLDDVTALSLSKLYQAFTQDKQGVHLGGDLTRQKLLSYKNLNFAEQTQLRKPGSGFVPDPEEIMNVSQIIIPMNKGIIPETDKQETSGEAK